MVAISEICAFLEGTNASLDDSRILRKEQRKAQRQVRNNNEEEEEKNRGSNGYNYKVILKHTRPLVDNSDDTLEPVNGFICFINLRIFAVCIYNIFTLEVTTPWIKSTLFIKQKEGQHDGVSDLVDHEVINYGFGFDPATKEHKVICVWGKTTTRIGKQYMWECDCEFRGPTMEERCRSYLACDAVCEVLTVGQNSWRKIDEVPPYYLVRGPVYANGSIYWTNFNLLNDERHGHHHPQVIVAFDVGSEKFRVIPIPDFILQDFGKGRIVDLLEVGERLALVQQMKLKKSRIVDSLEVGGRLALLRQNKVQTSRFVKLWIFDDNLNKESITSTTSNSNWFKETVTLPFSGGRYVFVYFHPVAGTNKIIVEAYHSFDSGHIKDAHLYSYNWKKMTFKKIGISGISPLDLCRSSLLTNSMRSRQSCGILMG